MTINQFLTININQLNNLEEEINNLEIQLTAIEKKLKSLKVLDLPLKFLASKRKYVSLLSICKENTIFLEDHSHEYLVGIELLYIKTSIPYDKTLVLNKDSLNSLIERLLFVDKQTQVTNDLTIESLTKNVKFKVENTCSMFDVIRAEQMLLLVCCIEYNLKEIKQTMVNKTKNKNSLLYDTVKISQGVFN